MARGHDLLHLATVLPARAVNVALTVVCDGTPVGVGHLWFDGQGWHPRLSFGRMKSARPLAGPVELVILAKLPPAMRDHRLALIGLRQIKRAVL